MEPAQTLPILTTARLILRPLELADAEAVQQIFPQWQIVRFLASSVPWPYPADGAQSFIRDVALKGMREGHEWHWSLRLKSLPDRLIGLISLRDTQDDNRGFWLDPQFHGQGLMTEGCEAATRFWFEDLKRPVLRVPKAAPNIASRRISQRAGMRVVFTEERDYVGGRFTTEVWELSAEEWQRRQDGDKGPEKH